MPITSLNDIEIPAILEPLRRRDISLWILPGAKEEDLRDLLRLPWVNIWTALPTFDIDSLWAETNPQRSSFTVARPEQDHSTFRSSEFVRIYDLRLKVPGDRLQKRNIDRLMDRVEEATGLLCFVGTIQDNWESVLLAKALAPNLSVILLNSCKEDLTLDQDYELLCWQDKAKLFVDSCIDITTCAGDPAIVNLKDAPNVSVDSNLLEDVSRHWTFFNNAVTTPLPKVSQDEFDAFLNGDEAWNVYAAGGPYRRKSTCYKESKGESAGRQVDFLAEVQGKIEELEHADLNPNELFEQVLIFCEAGSGATTLLRQAAMHVAMRGFPCLISKPYPQNFGGRSLENFIVDIQDRWLKHRRGKGSGVGKIPVCLFIFQFQPLFIIVLLQRIFIRNAFFEKRVYTYQEKRGGTKGACRTMCGDILTNSIHPLMKCQPFLVRRQPGETVTVCKLS